MHGRETFSQRREIWSVPGLDGEGEHGVPWYLPFRWVESFMNRSQMTYRST